MTTMRAVQVSRPNGPFEIVDRQIPEPGAGSVRIQVQLVASATAIRSPRRELTRAFSTRGYPGTRWPG